MEINDMIMSSSRKKIFNNALVRWNGSRMFKVITFVAALPVFLVVVPIALVLSPIILAWDFAGALTQQRASKSMTPWGLPSDKWNTFFFDWTNNGGENL